MNQNVGTLDRVIRSAVGALMAAVGLLADHQTDLWNWGLLGLGAALFLTALLGICPVYWLFGLRTCRP